MRGLKLIEIIGWDLGGVRSKSEVRPPINICSVDEVKAPKNILLNAARKSLRRYAYNKGLPAEFKWLKMIHMFIMRSGTPQFSQKAWIQLIVYKGIQQMMKNSTMIDRFCVALTSLRRASARM